jgi:large subunit ribosomal protein L15
MNIAEVNNQSTGTRKERRVGRGIGSGRGKTSQRGHKGQGSRSGSSMNPVFEGGQMPLVRRIPKRGFNNKEFADKVVGVNVDDLDLAFEVGAEVNPTTLQEKGVVKKVFDKIKILGNGEIKKALNVTVHRFSETAKQKIEAAGGQAVLLPEKQPVVKNKMGSRKKAAEAAAKAKSGKGNKPKGKK